MDNIEQRKLHETVDLLGFRAQATAVGLIQLAIELKRARVLDDDALGRIKDAICGDIMLSRPASIQRTEYERTVRRRLDALFSGNESVGEVPPSGLGPQQTV